MAEVKWIKVTTDVFDDEKILLIECLPEADSIIVIWFKLLCLAGKQNNSGVFLMGNRIPYNTQMLATIFRRKESTVQLALQTFEQFGMIEYVDDVITIPNWGKHQNLDQLESKKEYMRNYMKDYRAKQKAITSGKSNCKTNSKSNVSSADKEKIRIEEEKEREREEINKEKARQLADLFNSLCPSFSNVVIISDSMKDDIAESLTKYTEEQFKAVFEKAEKSSFLKGLIKDKNGQSWKATFDWLIKAENIAKVLNGNFDDAKDDSKEASNSNGASYDLEAYARMNKEKEPVYARNNPDVQARADALKQQLAEGSV